jgi:asparagine synthase (glutamine-hydrolysing)
MCGLVGVASNLPQTERTWLARGRDALIHRGPDDFGEWWSADGRVGLAHQRLSIIDLSPAGHQPMHLGAEGLSIVFNGEIYNFAELRRELEQKGRPFRSHSDTEVLLAAYAEWGTACLARLNGMFAFALYDAPRDQLFLARDRAGEKPLFYRLEGHTLYFASELKALFANSALPRRIDPDALDCYLAMGFVPGERCILQGYHKLMPAHAMSFDLRHGVSKIWRYWQLPELENNVSEIPENVLLDELEVLLKDAVGRQLVADVPVGILLSGGVDSSLITAMAVRASSQVQTFTIGFPGQGKLDETEHARLVARHFGTRHLELMAEPVAADLLPRLAGQFDEPMADSSMIPTFLVSQLVRNHCAVALGGDGADELFGGYGHYSRLQWLQNRLRLVPQFAAHRIARVAEQVLPVGFAGSNIRTWLMALGQDFQSGLPQIATCFDRISREKLMTGYPGHIFIAEGIHFERTPANPDLLQRATRMDFGNYLTEDILVKVDRASMLNSLEVRAPFLDYRLVEFAFGKVPSHLKATGRSKKILLKRLTERLLPPEFDRQRKQGFSIPLNEWLKQGPFRNLFYEVLSDPHCSFNVKAVSDLLSGQDKGRNNGERIFNLVLFELWRREYKVSI